MRRDAFTIIEVLISVIILSISILLVVKIHSDNHEQIIYISERNKLSLQDSLFTSPDILSYHMDNRSVYDIIGKSIYLNNDLFCHNNMASYLKLNDTEASDRARSERIR